MKALRAVMLASACALTTAGSASAPLLDVERSDTYVIIAAPTGSGVAAANAVEPFANGDALAGTSSSVAETPTATVTETPTTTATGSETTTTTTTTTTTVVETPTMTTLAESTEMVSTTVVETAGGPEAPADL